MARRPGDEAGQLRSAGENICGATSEASLLEPAEQPQEQCWTAAYLNTPPLTTSCVAPEARGSLPLGRTNGECRYLLGSSWASRSSVL